MGASPAVFSAKKMCEWEHCSTPLYSVHSIEVFLLVSSSLVSNFNLCFFKFYRELNIDGANQTLRIIKNLIDAGSCQSYAAIDISLLLEFTNLIIKTKLSNAYGLVVKVLLAVILCFFLFTIKNIATSK